MTDYSIDYWPGDSPDGDFPATRIADWVMVAPDISAMAFRVYCVMRAVTDIKGQRQRNVSLQRLRAAVPGDTVRGLSQAALEDVLQELEDAGLLQRDAGQITVLAGHDGPGGAR